ncbi:MAG: hypothetical protein ACF8AM_23000 [Rhodopirellula sp. JB055]|uniref:hypothetical protein n=1 Tax=Rhodopirellula sp. JB055 TaxID=3342846 RepID=UPI00370CA82B
MNTADANRDLPSSQEEDERTERGPNHAPSTFYRSVVIQPGTVAPRYWNGTCADDATQWSNRPVATLAVLFFVTGAFGIPLLWRHPNFSSWQRVFWSVAVLIYTVALFAGVGMLVLHTLDPARGS